MKIWYKIKYGIEPDIIETPGWKRKVRQHITACYWGEWYTEASKKRYALFIPGGAPLGMDFTVMWNNRKWWQLILEDIWSLWGSFRKDAKCPMCGGADLSKTWIIHLVAQCPASIHFWGTSKPPRDPRQVMPWLKNVMASTESATKHELRRLLNRWKEEGGIML